MTSAEHLRAWQRAALTQWRQAEYRGVVAAVTGSGKTFFALACVESVRPDTTLIIVPTAALLDQWWEEAANFFGLELDEINVIVGGQRIRRGTINIAVINTAAKLAKKHGNHPAFIIVDECHKAGAESFRGILDLPSVATLGLSATPARPYDDAFGQVVAPALGEIVYRYGYADALADGVIVPFKLINIVFRLEEETQKEYDRLTKGIAKSISQNGAEDDKTIALYLKRSRVLSRSQERARIALKIVAGNPNKNILIFHEDINACEVIAAVLWEFGVKAGIYHSRKTVRERAEILKQYRKGSINVLVTCRALDEGFNVPETEIGIIAAGTATDRQRIQRLGRIVRPAAGKRSATIYTLVATDPEIRRLKSEESTLADVATVEWSKA